MLLLFTKHNKLLCFNFLIAQSCILRLILGRVSLIHVHLNFINYNFQFKQENTISIYQNKKSNIYIYLLFFSCLGKYPRVNCICL